MKNSNILIDTLTNCCSDCVHSNYGEGENPATMYARGIVHGIISTLIAQGKTFEQAVEVIIGHAPSDTCMGSFDWASVPLAYREEFGKHWPESYNAFCR